MRPVWPLAVLLPLLWLAGCATPPPSGAAPGSPGAAPAPTAGPQWVALSPEPPGPGLGGRPAVLPAVRERLRLLALQEWTLWGRARWRADSDVTEEIAGQPRHHESEPAFSARVLSYWLSFKGRDFDLERIRFPDGSLLPWSAAFLSHLVRAAGVPEDQFNAHELHWQYIRAALENNGRPGFDALDAATTAPQPADMICAPRDAAPDTPRSFTQWRALPRTQRARRWAWHCDLVVDIAPGEAGAIGGNVAESVAWTRTPLDAEGRLQPTPERPWMAVLRYNPR